jgi:carbamate kinase
VITIDAPPLAVVALGGNALQDPQGDSSVEADFEVTRATAAHLAAVIASGTRRLVISHGNGPQVGNHLLRSELAHQHGMLPDLPLDVCVADTQGGMGYVLQQCLSNALHESGVPGVVATVVTQIVVESSDPAFAKPSKPVGRVVSGRRAAGLRKRGWNVAEDRGGYRRVVPSPDPSEIVEAAAIRALVEDGVTVIAAGGGGVPVTHDDRGDLHGIAAVIDKDIASSLLAIDLRADSLVILTDVDRAYVDYGTPRQQALDRISVARARELLDEGQFPAGSMGPKVEACCRFAEAAGRSAVIASIDSVEAALEGSAGTHIDP